MCVLRVGMLFNDFDDGDMMVGLGFGYFLGNLLMVNFNFWL